MWRRAGPGLVLLLGPLLATGVALDTQADSPLDVVAAFPNVGDLASYHIVRTADEGGTAREERVLLEWRTDERRLWDGSTATFLGLAAKRSPLSATVVGSPLIDLYTVLPGPRAAVAGEQIWSDDGEAALEFNVTYRDVRLQGPECGGPLVGFAVGASEAVATRALRACFAYAGGAADPWLVEAVRETHPRFGWSWTVRIERTMAAAPEGMPHYESRSARFVPWLSLPVETLDTATTATPAGERTVTERSEMTGWAAGQRPIPAANPLPPLPTVPLVRWGAWGPETGDLPLFPVAEARRALERTEEGARFFGRNPDATVAYTLVQDDFGRFGTVLGDCSQPRLAPSAPSPRTPAPAQNRWQAVRWVGGDESLSASVVSPGAAQDAQVGAGLAHVVEGPATGTNPYAGGVPALGPDPTALADARGWVEAMGGAGRLFVDVYPFEDMQNPLVYTGSPVENLVPTPDDTLIGHVGLLDCGPTPDRRLDFQIHGVRFIGGLLQHWWICDVGVSPEAASAIPLLAPPPWDGPIAPDQSRLRPASFGTTAAMAVGAALLIPIAIRVGAALFSRFTPHSATEHPLRATILRAVHDRPGVALPVLAAELGVHRAKAAHHLRMMERHGLVRVVRTWRGLVVHPVGHAGSAVARVMARAHAVELVEAVEYAPGITVSALAAALAVPKGRVSTLVRDLEEAGVLARRREGREVRISRAPRTGASTR